MLISLVQSNVVDDSRVIRACNTAKMLNEEIICIGLYEKRKVNEYNNFNDFPIEFAGEYKRQKKHTLINKILTKFLIMYKMIRIGIKHKPRVIHANDLDTAIPAIILKKIFKAKFIFDAHEIYSENTSFKNKILFKKLIKYIEKIVIKQSDEFITVSHSAKQYYENELGVEKVNVITNVPTIKDVKFLNKVEHFTATTHGYLLPNRGLEELASLGEALSTQEVHLCIRGEGKLKEELQDILEKQNLDYEVLKEFVNNTELLSLTSQYHIGLVLTKPVNDNYKLSVSNKLFEFINAGLPVIMSNIPEHKFINDKYNIGVIIDEVTTENIYNTVIRLKENQVLYDKLKENCESTSLVLNWQVESEKLAALYKYEEI